jgi:hypothetical protein
MPDVEFHFVPMILLLAPDDTEADFVDRLRTAELDLTSIPRLNLSPSAELLFAGTIAMQSLVRAIDFLRRSFRRGAIVEERNGQIVIRTDPGLPRGTLVVKAEGIPVEVREAEPLPPAVVEWLSRRS